MSNTDSSDSDQNEEIEQNDVDAEDDNSDNQSDDERATIRAEISSMSFEDLTKLKEKLGSRIYNETIFGKKENRKKKIVKSDLKRENKNRPREMGVRRPVPMIGKDKKQKTSAGVRDPRFDPNCGDFDAKTFRDNFSFVSEIKEKELVQLKAQLKETSDPKKQKKLKFLIRRMENQNLEKQKLEIREKALAEQKEEIKKAKQSLKKPYYMPEHERKTRELIDQFVELKESGKLDKHLVKRRKKNATKERKKMKLI